MQAADIRIVLSSSILGGLNMRCKRSHECLARSYRQTVYRVHAPGRRAVCTHVASSQCRDMWKLVSKLRVRKPRRIQSKLQRSAFLRHNFPWHLPRTGYKVGLCLSSRHRIATSDTISSPKLSLSLSGDPTAQCRVLAGNRWPTD